jgi:hypothetical protein
MKKECSIIFYEGWIDVAPTVLNLAKALYDKNYNVTIYCRQSQFNTPNNKYFFDKFVSVVYFESLSQISNSLFLLKILFKLLNVLKLGTLIPLIDVIFFWFQIRICKSKHTIGLIHNELIIGIDTNGAIVSILESILVQTKNLVYLSLELTRKENFRYFDKARYFLDKISYKNSKCLIIQDDDRFNNISKYSGYDQKNVFYIPNSDALGMNFVEDPNFNYFRQIFDLDNNHYSCIVVHPGMICDEVFSKELAASFKSINTGYALVFHERCKRSLDDPYLKSLKEINSKNLFLSLDPVPYEQIYKIFISTNVGIAFYKDIDENFSQISKASGKLALYLKYGKPVLMNDLESFRNLNDKYKLGIIIKDVSNHIEIESAIEEIMKNYEYFSENALTCFKKEFDFTVNVSPFLDFLEIC